MSTDQNPARYDAQRLLAYLAVQWLEYHPAGQMIDTCAKERGWGRFGAVMAVLYLVENKFLQATMNAEQTTFTGFRPMVTQDEFATEFEVLFTSAKR